jgi:superfamily I DNA and RNA helicase
MQIFPKKDVFRSDRTARSVLDYLIEHEHDLTLQDALVFCEFPLFREEEELLVAKLVLIDPLHGVLLVSTADAIEARGEIKEKLEGTFNQVFARLVKVPRLRAGRKALALNLDAILWVPELAADQKPDDSVVVGYASLATKIGEMRQPVRLPNDVFAELVSVLDGSKALIRPPERDVARFSPKSKVVQIQALEEEIRRFDRDQRVAYMSEVTGTQRIRGLAGSGKTVVLALQAALTAIRHKDARIAFTFYTRSLYQHVKQLITRFYRLHEDRDPDWNQIKVLHAWGGALVEGLYSYSSRAFGATPLTYAQASAYNPRQPFGFACGQLMEHASVRPLFDFIFLDEAQDFPPEFLRLALSLAEDERLVIAYDALQTIFDVEIPTAGSLFGTDSSGEPAVTFDEDVILRKCYRNPREVLVTAHAIGFGIYGPKVVQMLESKEHWEDFGYKVRDGELESGHAVRIERPVENSPSSISATNTIDELVAVSVYRNASEEVDAVASAINNDIVEDGVRPEDVLVICTDDRNARAYFGGLAARLAEHGIQTNNIQQETFGLRDFQAKDKVTLSTVYRAKGNEAYVVYLLGVDALFGRPTPRNRNIAFTAMTRAKGWLRASGIGAAARQFADEVQKAKAHFPLLEFTYPSEEELVIMKRDLTQIPDEEINQALDNLALNMSDEDIETMLARKLKEIRARKKNKRFTSQSKTRKK